MKYSATLVLKHGLPCLETTPESDQRLDYETNCFSVCRQQMHELYLRYYLKLRQTWKNYTTLNWSNKK